MRVAGQNTTMRTIHDHEVNGLNEAIKVLAVDAPGPGGANHQYRCELVTESIQHGFDSVPSKTLTIDIIFQNGPIGEAGFNGISNESLQAILIDRMRGFQFGRQPDGNFDYDVDGKYACQGNADALFHMEKALEALQSRTRARLARGVEGTHQV